MRTKVFYLTTRIMVAVVLLAILAVKAFAGETPKLKMVPYSSEKAIIAIDNTYDAVSELTIEDADGHVLYYKEGKISDKVYSKIFDFKNLNDGKYTITVKNIHGAQSLDFLISDNKYKSIESEEAHIPYFEVKDNLLLFSLLNYNLEDVNISLTDRDGNSFTKYIGNDFSITEGLNISNLFDGEYAVVIKNGKKRFNYNFEK